MTPAPDTMIPSDTALLAEMLGTGCAICGGSAFSFQEVLWPELIAEWELDPAEARYINVQQGFYCNDCGGNLRSLTLARAICRSRGFDGTLGAWVTSAEAAHCKILEINAAGTLTKHLRPLAGHVLVSYPEADIHALAFPDGGFDLVIHSDTLEHVRDPVHALIECRRVLKPGGTLAFTVPMIVGRMTRFRTGLAPSYHGAPSDNWQDYIVETEFGADTMNFVVMAGFDRVTVHSDIYPASFAFAAVKG